MGCNNDCNCGSCCPGPQGEKGDAGNQGIQGPPGPQGEAGPPGAGGTQGPSGNDGVDGFGYNASSTNTIDVLDTASATVNFVIDVEKAYTPGARVRVSNSANPTVDYFEGVVTGYDSSLGSITVSSIDVKEGSGTHSSWNINLAGDPGDPGIQGTQGVQGPQGVQGATGPTGSTGPAGADGADGSTYTHLLDASGTEIFSTSTGISLPLFTYEIPAGTLNPVCGLKFKFFGRFATNANDKGIGIIFNNTGIVPLFSGPQTASENFYLEFEVFRTSASVTDTGLYGKIIKDNSTTRVTHKATTSVDINDWTSASNFVNLRYTGTDVGDVTIYSWQIEKMYSV